MKTALIILIVLVFCSFSLVAQVTIKEKVVITTNRQISQALPAGGVQSGFIMPKKGVVVVYYSSAQRLGDIVPSTAKLRVERRRADTVMTDPVAPRFYNLTFSVNNNCATINQYNYDQAGFPGILPPFSAMTVLKGDTVQFMYLTDLYPVNGVMDTLAIVSADTTAFGWDVTFGIYDNCRTTWSDMLNVFIGVADTTITFTPLASNIVYPTYPGQNDALSKKNYVDLQLKTEFNGTPIKNYWVKVDSAALVDSGGHTHGGNRPVGKYRVPKVSGSGYDTVSTFTRQTDSLGLFNFRFLASQFGGIERIKAKRLSDTTSFDTLRLSTRVLGLDSLSTTHSNLITYTSTEAYHKRRNSNYGLPDTRNSIYAAIDQYATQYGMPANIYLAVVDMSLPYGGGFDVAGGWGGDIVKGGAGHITHRVGKSVDFSKFYRDANGNSITVNIYWESVLVKTTNRVDGNLLDRIFDRLAFDRKEKPDKIHYESR